MNQLLKKNTTFSWEKPQEEAFNSLKNHLLSSSVLERPDWDQSFTVQTDGSALGLGAILIQKNHQGWDAVLCYASKSTSEAESNYHAYNLEILAIVWAVEYFHYYLIGRPFTIQTDNQSITWLNNIKKEAKGQIAR